MSTTTLTARPVGRIVLIRDGQLVTPPAPPQNGPEASGWVSLPPSQTHSNLSENGANTVS